MMFKMFDNNTVYYCLLGMVFYVIFNFDIEQVVSLLESIAISMVVGKATEYFSVKISIKHKLSIKVTYLLTLLFTIVLLFSVLLVLGINYPWLISKLPIYIGVLAPTIIIFMYITDKKNKEIQKKLEETKLRIMEEDV